MIQDFLQETDIREIFLPCINNRNCLYFDQLLRELARSSWSFIQTSKNRNKNVIFVKFMISINDHCDDEFDLFYQRQPSISGANAPDRVEDNALGNNKKVKLRTTF
jgi:hypothetical protein